METAKAWGIPPHIWDDYPQESRAEMMAYERVVGGMKAYAEWMADKKQQEQRAKRAAKGR